MKIMTTPGGAAGRAAVCRTSFQPDAANREELILNLYPEERFQTFLGFGGAVTDSAAYVYSTLAPELRAEVVGACYGEEGLGYTLARSHIDSCDFSTEPYCADALEDDAAPGQVHLPHAGRHSPGLSGAQADALALVAPGVYEGQRGAHRRRKAAPRILRTLGQVYVQVRAGVQTARIRRLRHVCAE